MKVFIASFISALGLMALLSYAPGEMAFAADAASQPAVTQTGEAQTDPAAPVAHASSVTPEKLKDLGYRVLNFIPLVVILAWLLGRMIVSSLANRQQRIREELADLQTRRDEAEASYRDFEARLAGMEQEMEHIVEKAIAQAQQEKERILIDADRAAEEIKRQAEAAVQAEIENAKRHLRETIAEQAAAMAEELIVKNLTPADQVVITEQYLERVGAAQ